MAADQELFQALGMLQQGVQQFTTTRAIREANAQVDQIRNSELKDEEKTQQLRQVAHSFTMRLAGMGAPAQTINQVSEAIAPKPQLYQSPDQAIIMGTTTGDKKAVQAGWDIKAQDAKNKKDLFSIATGAKGAKADVDNTRKDLNTFRDKVAAPELKAMSEFSALPELFSQAKATNNNFAYVQAVKNIIKINDPRITDKDFDLSVPDKSGAAAAKRAYAAMVHGGPLSSDVDAIAAVATVLQKKNNERLHQKAVGFANTRSKLLKADPQDLYQNLMTESLPGYAPGVGMPAGGNSVTAPAVGVDAAAAAPAANRYIK